MRLSPAPAADTSEGARTETIAASRVTGPDTTETACVSEQ